ncbi:MAG: FxsA family protein [Pseudomonadales bacterium]
MPLLLLFFVITPVLEMVLLIKIGGLIGALNTVALVLLTAMAGLYLLKREGLATLWRANQRMEAGEMPAQEILEGLALAVGGALLLTPGFFTDFIGFCLLIPPARRWLIRTVFVKALRGGSVHFHQAGSFHQADKPEPEVKTSVIEGEFERKD